NAFAPARQDLTELWSRLRRNYARKLGQKRLTYAFQLKQGERNALRQQACPESGTIEPQVTSFQVDCRDSRNSDRRSSLCNAESSGNNWKARQSTNRARHGQKAWSCSG